MKRLLFFFLVPGLCLSLADSLDYANYAMLVSVSGGKSVELLAVENLKARAIDVLERGSYDRDMTVADYLARHDKQAKRLERMTLTHRRGGTRFRSDGGVSVDYEFPVTGAVLEQLLPEAGEARLLGPVACPCCGQPWPEGREVPEGIELVPYETDETPAYTGILVDVRGLGFRPALFPRVVNGDFEVVIGPGFANEDELAENGAFGYFTSRTDALMSDRIGSNPLVVRAVAVTGTNMCDPQVSDFDAARIHGSMLNLEHLAACRVGMLVD